jgi:hypothetical protein
MTAEMFETTVLLDSESFVRTQQQGGAHKQNQLKTNSCTHGLGSFS